MITVGHFTQYLNKQQSDDACKASLLNFLKNFESPQRQLSQQLFLRYIDWSLHFDHWRNNKKSLESFLLSHMTHFLSSFAHNFSLDQLAQRLKQQVVVLDDPDEFKRLVEKSAKKSLANKNQAPSPPLPTGPRQEENHEAQTSNLMHKTIPLKNSQLLSISFEPNKSLDVKKYVPLARITLGELHLLTPLTHLSYNEHLEMNPLKAQSLELETNTICQLSASEAGGVQGHISMGHSFKKIDVFSGPLPKFPRVFYPIRDLEQYFIQSDSDPYYYEISNDLEKALQLIASGHAESLLFGRDVLKRAKLAAKHVFANDELIRLNIANLEFQINKFSLRVQTKEKAWQNHRPRPNAEA